MSTEPASSSNGILTLAGRILLAAIFILSGFGKITGFDGTVGYIASKGLPLPQLGAIAAIVVEFGGGLALLAGFKARWAAAAMAVFSVAAGVIFHNFWALPAEQVMIQQIMFMKNLAMAGGLLFVVAYGPGPLSIDKA